MPVPISPEDIPTAQIVANTTIASGSRHSAMAHSGNAATNIVDITNASTAKMYSNATSTSCTVVALASGGFFAW